MKALCFCFLTPILTMGCAVWIEGTSYAALSQQTSAESSAHEKSAKPASDRPLEDVSPDPGRVAPVDSGKPKNRGISADQPPDHHPVSSKNHPRSRAGLTAANRPKQLPISRRTSLPGNAMNVHPPGSDKSGGAAKGGFIKNERVTSALTARPTGVARSTVASLNPLPNHVRHRGPNPAVVGGSANPASSNTRALNGTRMNRKP
jgi:hypothetical protein